MLWYWFRALLAKRVPSKRRPWPRRRIPSLLLESLEDRFVPAVSSITPSTTLISDAAAGTTFTIQVAYAQDMDTSVNPTITFGTDVSSTLTFSSAAWTDARDFVASYSVADANVSVPSVDVTATGGQDTAGNAEDPFTAPAAFGINTQDAAVLSVTPSANTIATAQVGQTFTLTVVYSETMDTTVNPTLTFSPDVSSTLTASGGSWSNGTTFVASYTVANANVATSDINVTVNGAKDPTGAAQVPDTAKSVFSIDTQDPAVSSITPSVTTLSSAQAGQTFSLTIVYSEAMNTSINPTLAFSPDVSSTLTATTSSWSNSTTFVASYSVANAGASITGVGVTVDGAQDAAGNAQVPDAASAVFNVATQAPTVSSITPSTGLIGDAQAGQAFTLTVVFSTAMNATVNPTFTFSPDVSSTLTFASGSWSNVTTFVAAYSVADANTTIPAVSVTVSGAQDTNGNTQAASTFAGVFRIDTQNPVLVSIFPSVDTLNSNSVGSTFLLTLVFSEPMNTSSSPSVSFPGVDLSTTLRFTQGSWISANVFQAAYQAANSGLTQHGIAVSVSGTADAAGNAQLQAATVAGVFSIDFQRAKVTGVTTSASIISRALVGHQFTVTITYDKAMSQATRPEVVFPGGLSSTLELASRDWTDASTYVVTYLVTDTDVQYDGREVKVAGARDPAGNVGNSSDTSSAFQIDTHSPHVRSILPLDANPTGQSSVRFQVTFDDAISSVAASDFTPTLSGDITGAHVVQVAKVDSNVYTVTVNTGTRTGTLGLQLKAGHSITDWGGNPLTDLAPPDTQATGLDVYAIQR